MPSGRDSFRRNRVAPSGYSLAFLGVSGFGCLVVDGAARSEFTVDSDCSLPSARSSVTAMDGGFCTSSQPVQLRGLVGKGTVLLAVPTDKFDLPSTLCFGSRCRLRAHLLHELPHGRDMAGVAALRPGFVSLCRLFQMCQDLFVDEALAERRNDGLD